MHVWVAGKGFNLGAASDHRNDLAAFFPQYGGGHAYSAWLGGVPRGRHTACAFGIDEAPPGGNSVLGCREVVVPGGSPFGAVDGVHGVGGNQLRLIGWTLDPDTVAPTDVHVYVDGVGYNLGPADRPRHDLAAAFPSYGSARGFDAVVPATFAPGPHVVCSFAIDRRGGDAHSLMNCRTVVL